MEQKQMNIYENSELFPKALPSATTMDLAQKQRKGKSAMEESSPTSMDNLPETILQHILSFNPTSSAVKTTIVSPAWRNLWHSLPILNFDLFDFHSSNIPPGESYQNDRQVLAFTKFIWQTLQHRPRHFPLKKFKLLFYYKDYEFIQTCVNSWINFAISSKAVELDLHFLTNGLRSMFEREVEEDEDIEEKIRKIDAQVEQEEDTISNTYQFHFSNLINSSVEVLKLCGFKSYLHPGPLTFMKLDSIREMHLQQFICTDREIIQHLMASCVNLEALSIIDIWGELYQLKIVSPKLKHFKLRNSRMLNLPEENTVEICAPCLESLEIANYSCGLITLSDGTTRSVVAANVEFNCMSVFDFSCWTLLLGSLDGVQRLITQNMWADFLEQNNYNEASSEDSAIKSQEIGVFSETFVFHNLKHLELLTGYKINDILGLELALEKCPKLETLVLVFLYNLFYGKLAERQGKQITFKMPCLKVVKIKEYMGTKTELDVIKLLKKHGVVLEKIITIPAKGYLIT